MRQTLFQVAGEPMAGALRRTLLLIILSMSAPFSAHAGDEPLRIGFLPYIAPSQLIERYTPLADYLGKALGRPGRVVIAKNYEEHIWNLNDGKIDIAFLGAASYVKLVEEQGERRLLARYEMDGRPTFQGIIFTSSTHSISTLAEVKGKRFAFGDPRSTLSHLVPRAMLLSEGIDITDLRKHAFLGSHDNVIMGVLFGRYDAGGVAEEVFAEHADKGLRVIQRSTPISTHVFVASDRLPDELRGRIAALLHDLKNHAEGRRVIEAVGAPVSGFVPAEDGDYASVRDVFRSLRGAGVEP